MRRAVVPNSDDMKILLSAFYLKIDPGVRGPPHQNREARQGDYPPPSSLSLFPHPCTSLSFLNPLAPHILSPIKPSLSANLSISLSFFLCLFLSFSIFHPPLSSRRTCLRWVQLPRHGLEDSQYLMSADCWQPGIGLVSEEAPLARSRRGV